MKTPTPESARNVHRQILEGLDRLNEMLGSPSLQSDGTIARRVRLAVASASGPTCADAQADGVPCATLGGECDRCDRALAFIREVHAEIEAESQRRDADRLLKLASRDRDLP
ncbi:MAG: hypothetical protein HY049_03245 [Acidobacteria bacterium]|nr:hypothetical protein [Acidobacteriota bacterium]